MRRRWLGAACGVGWSLVSLPVAAQTDAGVRMDAATASVERAAADAVEPAAAPATRFEPDRGAVGESDQARGWDAAPAVEDDWEEQGKALLALGLWKRPWEYQALTPWPSIGAFGSRDFEPELWKEAYPYWPFWEADVADHYWGAKQVVRFTRPMIEAIVAEAKLSDPDAARYLVDALLGRRHKIGSTWLEAVSPFDDFTIEDGRLCGVDLAVRYRIAREGSVVQRTDSGEIVDERRVASDGRACLTLPPADYAVLRLQIRRSQELRPLLEIHYTTKRTPRILGVIRHPL